MFRSAKDHHQGTKQSHIALNQISHFCIQLTWCRRVSSELCWLLFSTWFQETVYQVTSNLCDCTQKCLNINRVTLLHHATFIHKRLFWFYKYFFSLIPDDSPLRTKTYRKVQCDIVIQISKEQFCALCWWSVVAGCR